MVKGKHFQIIAKGIDREFENKWSQILKHHCHFLSFIILWPIKLKYSMRTLMNMRPPTLVDEENIQTSSQTEELTYEDIDEINSILYTRERFNV